VHDVNSPLRSGSITHYSESIMLPRHVCTRVVMRMRGRPLAHVFDRFRVQVEERKETKRKLARVLCKWTNSALRLGWGAWLEGTEVQADERALAERARDKVRQVVLKVLNASLSYAFEAWVDGTRCKRQARHVCTRVVMRMRGRTLAHVFDRFYVYVEERRVNMRKLVHELQRLLLEHTFGSWYDAIMDCRMEVGCNNIFCKVRTDHLCTHG